MNNKTADMKSSFLDWELDSLIVKSRKCAEGAIPHRYPETSVIPAPITLGVKKIYPDVQLPEYAHEGDACFDICCYGDVVYNTRNGSAICSTGLIFNIPAGYCLMIYSRSGQGFNNDTRLVNCVGVIDSGYVGELKIKLTPDSHIGQHYVDTVRSGDRIAQAMLVPVPRVKLVEVLDVKNTQRGVNGFGSTDK